MSRKYDENWFWGIIDLVQGDRTELKNVLTNFTREEIEEFQDHFIEFSVELQDEPFTDYMEESEDGIEDISHWIVSRGKKYYEEILKHPENVPESVEGHSEEILYGVANEVYYSRFQETMDDY